MREELTLISAKASNLQSPNFYDDTVLWTAFMLCGQIGPIEKRPLLQSMACVRGCDIAPDSTMDR